MEYEEVVWRRRSIRKFLKQSIEKEKVVKLLECARVCQSAKNRQPWKYMLLEADKKDMISNIMLALFEKSDIVIPGYMNSSKSSANIIKEAPLLILAFKEKSEDWHIGDLLSMGAAIEHICLEAVNLGLGSVWIRDTVYTENEICKAVGQEKLQLVSAIAIGYPAEFPNQRKRKALMDIMLQSVE